MKAIKHTAESRGKANFGWLDSKHTFSFGRYFNPERVHFGVLRVLNDDTVSGGMGFDTHAHDNMEIISIPLEGSLKHKDSMGNEAIIASGEIQVMSAGTGIRHSEFNNHGSEPVKFLQIWVIPKEQNVTPRYQQIELDAVSMKNNLAEVAGPIGNTTGVGMHQDAWFSMGDFEKDTEVEYKLKGHNTGVYAFVLNGNFTIGEYEVAHRDGLAVTDAEYLQIKTTGGGRILLMEVPLSFPEV